jgi:RimJ/RimL family protein N-acetyltransferase
MTAFRFERVTDADLAMLYEWVNRPHVAEWWDAPFSLEEVALEFAPRPREGGVAHYIAHSDERPVGFVQSYVAAGSGGGWWPDERDPGVVGIDLFLADPVDLGKGLGTAMIEAFVARLFEDPAVVRIQIDPDPENARAIRCYEKVGFAAVGIVETPDGPALLMTLPRSRARDPRALRGA